MANTNKTKIYSQASNDVVIPTYEKHSDAKVSKPNTIKSAIIIKGGANVAFSDTEKTRRNVTFAVTEVTNEELETLKDHPAFIRKVGRGFISIGKPFETTKADKSAQLTEKKMKAKNPKATAKVGDDSE